MALPKETATPVSIQPSGVITIALTIGYTGVMLMVALLPSESLMKVLLVEDTVVVP